MAGKENEASESIMLEKMGIEELEELLRLDLNTDHKSDSDTDFILTVMEVLERKIEVESPDKVPDVDAAWKTFTEFYLPCIESAEPIYDFDIEDEFT